MTIEIVRNQETGCFEQKHSCGGCQLLRINGVVCHETGCPEAWKDSKSECLNCGGLFKPEHRGEKFCDFDCAESYYG